MVPGSFRLFSFSVIVMGRCWSARANHKLVIRERDNVYGHSVRPKNGQVPMGCETERFLSWGTFCTLMHKLHTCTGLFASACLYKYFVSCRSYGWSSVSCSYSDAFLHTEFAVMGFFLLKYALHLGISHYSAWLLRAWQCRLLFFFFTASLPKRSEDSYRTCRLCHS